MKPRHLQFTLSILFCIFAQLVPAQDDKIPAELTSLKTQYDKAVERATKPVTAKYIRALKDLRVKFTKLGKLNEALAVEEIIKKLTTESTDATPKTLDNILKSKSWIYRAGKHVSTIKFHADGKAIMTGWTNSKIKWNITKDRYLTIIYEDGNSCKFEFKDLSQLTVVGRVNDRNQSARHLSPKE